MSLAETISRESNYHDALYACPDFSEVKDSTDISKALEETVLSPSHYQLFPEFNLEVKDVNKRLLSKIEDSDFDMNLFEAGWYQQAMQYFFRFYAKNGINDLEKGINSLQIMIDSYKERRKGKD